MHKTNITIDTGEFNSMVNPNLPSNIHINGDFDIYTSGTERADQELTIEFAQMVEDAIEDAASELNEARHDSSGNRVREAEQILENLEENR